MLKQIIFAAESVAHMRGYEREILPATDALTEYHQNLKAMIDLVESMTPDMGRPVPPALSNAKTLFEKMERTPL